MYISNNNSSEWNETDFNRGDAKATSFEDDAYAAGGDAFAKPTHNSTSNQHVLHFLYSLCLSVLILIFYVWF